MGAVLLGGEIEAGPSLEERAGVEGSIEEFEGSGIDGEEGSEVGEEARAPKVRRAPKGRHSWRENSTKLRACRTGTGVPTVSEVRATRRRTEERA